MIQFGLNRLATTLVASAGLAFLSLPVTMTAAHAQSTTKQCSTQYQAAKEAGTLNGQKWPQFLSECSAKLKGDNDSDAAAAPAKKTTKKEAKETTTKAKKAETAAAAPKSGMSGKSVTKQCSTQYQAAKEAGTLNGQKWPQFLSACSDSLKADNSDDATPDEPVVAPKKTAAAKPAKTQTASTTTSADGKPLSPAQIAFRARISECGDQWQQAKASNRTGGKTWPQYWSACNTRLKSE